MLMLTVLNLCRILRSEGDADVFDIRRWNTDSADEHEEEVEMESD